MVLNSPCSKAANWFDGNDEFLQKSRNSVNALLCQFMKTDRSGDRNIEAVRAHLHWNGHSISCNFLNLFRDAFRLARQSGILIAGNEAKVA